MSIQTAGRRGSVATKLSIRLLALAALIALPAAPAQAKWLRGESTNFVVHCRCSETELNEQLTLLENFDYLLRVITTVNAEPSPNKLDVYIVESNAELRIVRSVDRSVAGFYSAMPDGIAAFVNRRAPMDSTEVLFHEYVHHFMRQYAPASYPAWYVEGLAEYLMTTRFGPRDIEVGGYSEARVDWLIDGLWLPIERVLFGEASTLSGEKSVRYYAQSWLIVHYFFSDAERSKLLLRYFDAVFRGEDPRTAFESTTGLTPKALESQLRKYIGARRIPVQKLTSKSGLPTPVIRIEPMPHSADDLLLQFAALRLGLESDGKAKQLEKIRKAAARHASDPFALRVLARAEAVYGDPDKVDALIDPLLSAKPDDAELLYLKGIRHLRAAETATDADAELRTARQWFSRSHQADDNYYPTLFRYALSLRNDPDFASENTVNVLLLAHQLAPQVRDIRTAAVDALAASGDYAYAEAILMPLVTDPHNPQSAEWARARLDELRARAGRPADQPQVDAGKAAAGD